MWNTIKNLVWPRLKLTGCLFIHLIWLFFRKPKPCKATIQKVVKGTIPVIEIGFGPPSAERKKLTLAAFFRSPALWSSQNVYGPPTMVAVVGDIKDQGEQYYVCPSHLRSPTLKSISLTKRDCLPTTLVAELQRNSSRKSFPSFYCCT